MGEAAVVLSPVGHVVSLSVADELDLQWYFGLDLPPAPGTASTFGAMCDRLQRAHAKTTERPSEDASWTEIVFCGHAQAGVVADSAEDGMHAYIDARRRATKLRALIERLSTIDRAVLEARYGGGVQDDGLTRMFAELAGVVLLTSTVRVENMRRASNGRHEMPSETVLDVIATSKNNGDSKDARAAARRWIERARREAEDAAASATIAFTDAKRAAVAR